VAFTIAQLSDIHIGSPHAPSGENLSVAIDEINAMSRMPDLVLLTGDLTEGGTPSEWAELLERLAELRAPWEAIAGNHDRNIGELAGHRALDAGPLRLVLLDSSSDTFGPADATWLESELAAHADRPTLIAIHHPPFETGIWWMDCVGLEGADELEAVVRRHSQVIKVLSGHVHRTIQANWGSCPLWVCPSTAFSISIDLDPAHEPAESAEGPAFSLHAYTGNTIVSHVVPVGSAAQRSPIEPHAPEFISWVRDVQAQRPSSFA
jgi:3',5'-cyclic AMP phosphodiesterase CpdA